MPKKTQAGRTPVENKANRISEIAEQICQTVRANPRSFDDRDRSVICEVLSEASDRISKTFGEFVTNENRAPARISLGGTES